MGRTSANTAKRTEKRLSEARAVHQRKVHADFVRRHPEKARQERGFRKERAALQRDWGHKQNGTPETHQKAIRTQQGALARLFQSGAIDVDQLSIAVEIRAIFDRIGRDVSCGSSSLETKVDQSRSGDGAFHERLGAVRAEVAYGRWRACLKEPGPVLAMIAEDVGCSVAASRYRMRNERARALLIEALDMWPAIIGTVVKQIDRCELASVHGMINR